jgi:hypothetical protein
MARTTAALVGGIIEVDTAITLDPFINAANSLVTECCTGLDEEYSSGQLVIIETWLAAHFYTVRDPRAESEKAGSVSERFQSKVDLGLNTSHYGQMAMRLDYKGGLAELNNKTEEGLAQSVEINWFGTENPESTD